MILCYSGTGNSRYIAKRIADALGDEVIDLNAKIKANDNSPIQTGSNVVVVTPTYAWRIPRLVSAWLSKTELTGAERVWFVMNCGDGIGNADKYNRALAEQKQLTYMGMAGVIMPENYIAVFSAPDTDKARGIVAKAEPEIDAVIANIKAGEPLPAPKESLLGRFLSGSVNPIFYKLIVKADKFTVSDACVGCGLCVKNCPTNSITLKDGKPVWGSGCTHCMACICYCPKEAIEYGTKSVGQPRYTFEGLKIE